MKKKLTITAICLTVSVAGSLLGNDPVNEKTLVKTAPAVVAPHCQVPCGIYADQMRFEQMLEDTATIAKAIASINELAAGMADAPPNGKAINQVTRWVSTKENHATHTQQVIADYFLAQRIKADSKEYVGQLATSHRVIVAAMKCKQDSDPATAEALKKAILDLYRAYEGKEPTFESAK